MSDNEYDRWANGQIKDEFKKNAKDHLNKKFNKQDQDRIHADEIKRLNEEYLKIQNQHHQYQHNLKLNPPKNMRLIQKGIDKKEFLRKEEKIKERMKEIEQEIKERQKELEKSKDRQR